MDRIDIDAIYDKLEKTKEPAPLVVITNDWGKYKIEFRNLLEEEECAWYPLPDIEDKAQLLATIWQLTEMDWITTQHIHEFITLVLGPPKIVHTYP